MSTSGNIGIKLRPEDLDKDFHMRDENGDEIQFTIHTNSGSPYLVVYNHFDSHTNRLGKSLINNLTTYEEVRDFILQGDRSSFDAPYIRTEDPEDNQPRMCDDISGKPPFEYFYLFNDDGFWYVKTPDKDFTKMPNQGGIVVKLNEIEIKAIEFIIDKYIKLSEVFFDITELNQATLLCRLKDIKKKIRNVKNESRL